MNPLPGTVHNISGKKTLLYWQKLDKFIPNADLVILPSLVKISILDIWQGSEYMSAFDATQSVTKI